MPPPTFARVDEETTTNAARKERRLTTHERAKLELAKLKETDRARASAAEYHGPKAEDLLIQAREAMYRELHDGAGDKPKRTQPSHVLPPLLAAAFAAQQAALRQEEEDEANGEARLMDKSAGQDRALASVKSVRDKRYRRASMPATTFCAQLPSAATLMAKDNNKACESQDEDEDDEVNSTDGVTEPVPRFYNGTLLRPTLMSAVSDGVELLQSIPGQAQAVSPTTGLVKMDADGSPRSAAQRAAGFAVKFGGLEAQSSDTSSTAGTPAQLRVATTASAASSCSTTRNASCESSLTGAEIGSHCAVTNERADGPGRRGGAGRHTADTAPSIMSVLGDKARSSSRLKGSSLPVSRQSSGQLGDSQEPTEPSTLRTPHDPVVTVHADALLAELENLLSTSTAGVPGSGAPLTPTHRAIVQRHVSRLRPDPLRTSSGPGIALPLESPHSPNSSGGGGLTSGTLFPLSPHKVLSPAASGDVLAMAGAQAREDGEECDAAYLFRLAPEPASQSCQAPLLAAALASVPFGMPATSAHGQLSGSVMAGGFMPMPPPAHAPARSGPLHARRASQSLLMPYASPTAPPALEMQLPGFTEALDAVPDPWMLAAAASPSAARPKSDMSKITLHSPQASGDLGPLRPTPTPSQPRDMPMTPQQRVAMYNRRPASTLPPPSHNQGAHLSSHPLSPHASSTHNSNVQLSGTMGEQVGFGQMSVGHDTDGVEGSFSMTPMRGRGSGHTPMPGGFGNVRRSSEAVYDSGDSNTSPASGSSGLLPPIPSSGPRARRHSTAAYMTASASAVGAGPTVGGGGSNLGVVFLSEAGSAALAAGFISSSNGPRMVAGHVEAMDAQEKEALIEALFGAAQPHGKGKGAAKPGPGGVPVVPQGRVRRASVELDLTKGLR